MKNKITSQHKCVKKNCNKLTMIAYNKNKYAIEIQNGRTLPVNQKRNVFEHFSYKIISQETGVQFRIVLYTNRRENTISNRSSWKANP